MPGCGENLIKNSIDSIKDKKGLILRKASFEELYLASQKNITPFIKYGTAWKAQ